MAVEVELSVTYKIAMAVMGDAIRDKEISGTVKLLENGNCEFVLQKTNHLTWITSTAYTTIPLADPELLNKLKWAVDILETYSRGYKKTPK